MTVDEFIRKWRAADLKERSAAQEHFIDLCRLLGEPTPAEADPSGTFYCFERGASKTTGGNGWADVWKRGHFGWEYKGKRKDLTAAFVQLQQYALALENPPLLIVCDLERFIIRTNWTNSVSEVHELSLEDLRDASKRDILKFAMSEPERLRPGTTRATLTARAAADFATLANNLRERGHEAHAVAHFINRLVFCMFAEDVQLLPNGMFSRMLQAADMGGDFEALAGSLFAAMRTGGMVGFERVEHFNGGLFDTDDTLPLEADDISLCRRVAALDWGEIDPSILGTLFERGLDPSKRAQLGAHYTDRDNIMRIVGPVINRPWLADWAETKGAIETALGKASEGSSPTTKTKARTTAAGLYKAFLDRLRAYRVLDPACGSGNFLYLALRALKDIEHRAGLEAEALGIQREFPGVGPENVLGIEVNPYAAELARVTVWIGEIQWMRRNGFSIPRQPVLRPLSNIECRDAVLATDGTEATWPMADAVIGNPPFLGVHKFISSLGEEYSARLRAAYSNHLPATVDLVCFWIWKAWAAVKRGDVERVGFVATNSIRGGANRKALEGPAEAGAIFEAWSDEEWTIDGAAVRVSVVCFASPTTLEIKLDGKVVEAIRADLTGGGDDGNLLLARRLPENRAVSFLGTKKGGPFDIDGDKARAWLLAPSNPNGRHNADVIFPRRTGSDLVRRPVDRWVVDFGTNMSDHDAALYGGPFHYVEEHVRPVRALNRREWRRENFWLHSESAPGLRKALKGLDRYIATPRVSKHRLFVWLPTTASLDDGAVAIARSDDITFGIVQSRFHEAWSLRLGTALGVGNDPRYTPSTTFETFPFPFGMTPNVDDFGENAAASGIAWAAKRLDNLRLAWLNPPELVRMEPEVVPGLPDRVIPVDDKAAAVLAKRTLTALYNDRPTWLANAHAELDAAVAAAYGWPTDISTDDALERLLALNLERAKVTIAA